MEEISFQVHPEILPQGQQVRCVIEVSNLTKDSILGLRLSLYSKSAGLLVLNGHRLDFDSVPAMASAEKEIILQGQEPGFTELLIQNISGKHDRHMRDFSNQSVQIEIGSKDTTSSSTPAISAPIPFPVQSGKAIDFVIVTALSEEQEAVLNIFPGCRQLPPARDDIRVYFQSDLPVTLPDNSKGAYHIIVMCLLGMGRVQAAAAAADAIHRWHPRYILLTGIAGGLAAKEVEVGDIIISDQIVDYELQKLTRNGPQVRWEVHRADPRLLGACKNFREENWCEKIVVSRPESGRPRLHFGPIASGDKVIAFERVLSRYRKPWPKLIGVEMEAAGVATAAFQAADQPGFFMIRGVSDLADENKGTTDVERWRSYACSAAASFTLELLKRAPVPLSEEAIQVNTRKK